MVGLMVSGISVIAGVSSTTRVTSGLSPSALTICAETWSGSIYGSSVGASTFTLALNAPPGIVIVAPLESVTETSPSTDSERFAVYVMASPS